jgi:sialate O-acetylesterase
MKLPSLFSHHAIFQRGKCIPIWGWTQPEKLVTVSLGPVVAKTQSAKDGRFLLRLPPLSAGGPHKMILSSGLESIEVHDIFIGEVWVASGQSNMEWNMSNCSNLAELKILNNENIRMFKVIPSAKIGVPQNVEGSWELTSPEQTPLFSAVAYHFAEKIQNELNIPIGIISSNWGGTFIEAWSSRTSLIQNSATKTWVENYEATLSSPEYWEQSNKPWGYWYPCDSGISDSSRDWSDLAYSDDDWKVMELPCTWQSAGHYFCGVFWFRISVMVPDEWSDQDLELAIGAVDKCDITYFNGKQVGATGDGLDQTMWNIPRTYFIPSELVKTGRNVIAVRAYSFVSSGGMIGPASKMYIKKRDSEKDTISLFGEWRYKIEKNFGLIQQPFLAMGPNHPNSPYILYDNMIHPLQPYAIGGVIWYQGEANDHNFYHYESMLTSIIKDWRSSWGQGDFPFLIVQLANYGASHFFQKESSWAYLREAQLKASSMPLSGLAITIDIGEAYNIHPQNKRDVGHRLAQLALVKFFNKDGVPCGPIYQDMTVERECIRLYFNHIGDGLASSNGEELSHFVIAGSDEIFYPAMAIIDGDTIIVSSLYVAQPVAVRYAWADNPEGCNLFNKNGYPASPFRTDHKRGHLPEYFIKGV